MAKSISAPILAFGLITLAAGPLAAQTAPQGNNSLSTGMDVAPSRPLSAYVLMTGEKPVVRAIVDATSACPTVEADGKRITMAVRSEPADIAQRTTKSKPEYSKASRFPVQTCEAALPAKTRKASIAGQALPLPPAKVKRILVLGDTGCRIKASDNAIQACNDAAAWPFARIAAQAAAWKPDMVVHVGDYLYRENPCPEGHGECAGTPWGYGWDAWNADFFAPAQPLLAAAPWVMVRGNHESCLRAGQGWWRFLAAQALVPGQDCDDPANDVRGDQGDPFAVPLGGGAQIIAMDLAIAGEDAIAPSDPRHAWMIDVQRKLMAMAKGHSYTIATDHYPLLGLAASSKKATLHVEAGNAAIRSTFGLSDPSLTLPGIDLLLAGHVHEWQQADSGGHPSQFISGMAGTQEDVTDIPLDKALGAEPAPGAKIERFDIWTKGFGFVTLERIGKKRWQAEVHALDGGVIRRCRIEGRRSSCTA